MVYKSEVEALNDQTPGYRFKEINGMIYRKLIGTDRWDYHRPTLMQTLKQRECSNE